MRFEVRHAIAGRVRLHIGCLPRKGASISGFLCRLRGLESVTQVRHNPACRAVVVCYAQHDHGFVSRLEGLLRSFSPAEFSAESVAACVTAVPAKLWHTEESFLLSPTLSLAASLLGETPGLVLSMPLLVCSALPVWRRALTILRKEHRLNVDFLDSIAIVIAVVQGEPFMAAFVIWLIRLGDWIRDRTGAVSRRAISNLLAYQQQKAWRRHNGEITHVAVVALEVGDIVLVYPGDLIPVDGEVLEGRATVDQKTITGESLPVQRRAGDGVYAATVIREGKLVLRAVRVGIQTTAAQIVHLVETAPIGETRIQNYAEKFADRMVAPWLAASAGIFAMTGNLQRFLSMLIIDYGTGMRVAAPTTVLAAMTKAARHGIIIRSGSHMEKLARVDTIVFDKTGTLTRGVPEVLAIVCYRSRHFSERKIISLAASVEARHKHPVAEAILAKARDARVKIADRKNSRYEIGMGVEAEVNGYRIHLGSSRFFQQNGIPFDKAANDLQRFNRTGASTLLFAINGELTGLIPYVDQVRSESIAVLKALKNYGVKQMIMLTGDNQTVAAEVARRVGIDRFVSNTLPADKVEVVRELQKRGHVVAMVGDGINDSPALAFADIGIAMKNGADVARESADVVLMEDNLWKVLSAVELSRDAMDLVRENYAVIVGLNTLAVALAIPAGFVSPAVTALISNGSAILASLNAMRPLLDQTS
jgi:heavy metal translocating P-type ATPase